jgi:hypothetical protein
MQMQSAQQQQQKRQEAAQQYQPATEPPTRPACVYIAATTTRTAQSGCFHSHQWQEFNVLASFSPPPPPPSAPTTAAAAAPRPPSVLRCLPVVVCHRAWGGLRVPQVGQGYHWNLELRFQSSSDQPKVRGTWNPSPKGKGAEFLWPSS